MTLAALRLSAEDLNERVSRFGDRIELVEQDRFAAAALLTASVRQLQQEGDLDAEAFVAAAGPALADDLSRYLDALAGSARELEAQALAYAGEQIRRRVDPWQAARPPPWTRPSPGWTPTADSAWPAHRGSPAGRQRPVRAGPAAAAPHRPAGAVRPVQLRAWARRRSDRRARGGRAHSPAGPLGAPPGPPVRLGPRHRAAGPQLRAGPRGPASPAHPDRAGPAARARSAVHRRRRADQPGAAGRGVAALSAGPRARRRPAGRAAAPRTGPGPGRRAAHTAPPSRPAPARPDDAVQPASARPPERRCGPLAPNGVPVRPHRRALLESHQRPRLSSLRS